METDQTKRFTVGQVVFRRTSFSGYGEPELAIIRSVTPKQVKIQCKTYHWGRDHEPKEEGFTGSCWTIRGTDLQKTLFSTKLEYLACLQEKALAEINHAERSLRQSNNSLNDVVKRIGEERESSLK